MALILNQDGTPIQKNSVTQDESHHTKSSKHETLTPAETALIMADHGLRQTSLKEGRARLADRAAHQNVVMRFRAQNALSINGLWMEIVAIQKHLYGADQFFVGTWRQVCTNGLTVGQKFVSGRIVHLQGAAEKLNQLLPRLISQHDQLVAHIEAMMAREVSPIEAAQLTETVAKLRLEGTKNVSKIEYSDLTRVRRQEDSGRDLFTVLNVLQENTMRYGLRYQTTSPDPRGDNYPKLVRNGTARPLTRSRHGEIETVRSVELNASLWDSAMDILDKKAA